MDWRGPDSQHADMKKNLLELKLSWHYCDVKSVCCGTVLKNCEWFCWLPVAGIFFSLREKQERNEYLRRRP
jgi:hypothetical protein